MADFRSQAYVDVGVGCAYVHMCVCAYVRMCVCAFVRLCVCAYVRLWLSAVSPW
jgi:hypothetical protein